MDPILPAVILVILSVLSPLLIAVFNKVGWSPATKQVVTFAVALVIGVGYTIYTGGFANPADIVAAIGTAYALGQAVYQFLLKKLATIIEAATDPSVKKVIVNKGDGVLAITGNGTAVVEDKPATVIVQAPTPTDPPAGPVVKG